MKNSERKNGYFKGIMLFTFLLFVGAGSFLIIKESEEREKLEKQAALESEAMQKEQEALFSQIEQNLIEITAHENLVRSNLASNKAEGPLSPEERINNEIAIISDLIDQNNAIIDELNEKLNANNDQLLAYSERNKRLERKLDKFSKRIDELEEANALLAQQGEEMRTKNVQLTSDLALINDVMDSQVVHIINREIQLANLNEALNESYYLVGDFKELREMDIVEKEGGIIGIGGTKELKDDFNKEPFIRIDKSTYKTIPVFSPKAELATNHPTDSYRWVEDDDQVKWLEIVDPTEFWESSKYLVILTKDDFNLIKSA